MKFLILVVGFLYYIQNIGGQANNNNNKRLVCYYNEESFLRKGYAKFTLHHLEKALPNCTHLMYGYADINFTTNELSNLNLNFNITVLKEKFPHLKIYLSLGGDKNNDYQKYMPFLESGNHKKFIESSKIFLKKHKFNGLDLAFPFQRNVPSEIHCGVAMVKEKLFKTVDNMLASNHSDKYKEQYTNFVKKLKKKFVNDGLTLAMTVLPNVNSTSHFDIPQIKNSFEFINLFAFDFLTPDRNPKEADYTAPLYLKDGGNRLSYNNIDYQVNNWIQNGCPAHKLNLGIATYGRAWKLTTDSGLSGMPIVENTNGPLEKGEQSKIPGLLSYLEIWLKLQQHKFQKVVDTTQKYGNYAFYADKSAGTWISYDDPEFAAIKAEYVNNIGIGGIALYDLSYDDFRGHSRNDVFPILRSVSQTLEILKETNIIPANFNNTILTGPINNGTLKKCNGTMSKILSYFG